MFDSVRLDAELAHIHRALVAVAASPRGKGLVDPLRVTVPGTTSALVRQALLADCTRVVHGAMTADGQIDDRELEALQGALSSTSRHYAQLIPGYGTLAATDLRSARAFLAQYAADSGPFGHSAVNRWPGLSLCKRAAELGVNDALARYEETMNWLIAEACRVGGVAVTDARWRGKVDDLDELRQTLPRRPSGNVPGADRRIQAFLAPSGVFTAVQQPTSIYENDPFDVEAVHREARDSFEQLVKRARTPSPIIDRGRMLLVLGESGCGKTHVLRGFRRHVHEYGRGFVVYAQMQSNCVNYDRHLLQELVSSLTRPYAGPSGERTGLQELASGLMQVVSKPLQARIQQLMDDSWEEDQNPSAYINELTYDIVRDGNLSSFDPDLLRVMLYALLPDQAVTAAVYKYLRCENMNLHDLHWIGGVIPRTGEDHPHVMIKEIGRLAALTQRALVLMVDQADLTGYDPEFGGRLFRRTIDALYRVVSELPSAIAVVACLSDLYEVVRGQLNKPALDRLEKDPEIARLRVNRSYPEIEAIVSRRLAWLFAEQRAEYRSESPVYPVPVERLRGFINARTRDVLEWCHEYQAQCAAAGGVIDEDGNAVTPPRRVDSDLDQILGAWNEALRAAADDELNDEDEILEVIGAAARTYAEETALQVTGVSRDDKLLRLTLSDGAARVDLAIAITNNNYHRGSFAGQITTLRRHAGEVTALAVRTGPFPRGEASTKVVDELVSAGGRKLYVDVPTLRVLVTLQRFHPPFPADRIAAWLRRDRPISGLSAVADAFKLDVARRPGSDEFVDTTRGVSAAATGAATASPPRLQPEVAAPEREAARGPESPNEGTMTSVAHGAANASGGSGVATKPRRTQRRTPAGVPAVSEREPPPATRATGSVPPPASDPAPGPIILPVSPKRRDETPVRSTRLHLGTAVSLSSTEPRVIELGALTRHTAIVGNAGHGRTSFCLNVIEQVLERDVPVILIDTKGELAGYAQSDWWQRTADRDRARNLADRLDVRLFTPGARQGRPLILPVAPNLAGVAAHERDRRIRDASTALIAALRAAGATADAAQATIMRHAVAILAERGGERRLGELIALVEQRDAALVSRTGGDAAAFEHLARGLTVVQSTDAWFEPSAESFSVETLIGRGTDGRVPLTVVCLRFLGEASRMQTWLAYLSQHIGAASVSELRTLIMLDDADVFLPGGSAKPPSKEAVHQLLKREESGLGILLSSSNAADLDYRGHTAIQNWFIGRVDPTAIDKMKPLLEGRPPIATTLRNQERGRFVMLLDGNNCNLQREPSMMRRQALTDDELLVLAAQSQSASMSLRARAGRTPRSRSSSPRPSAS